MTSLASSGSRLPVGSSAISSGGRLMARAMPTRCCSPIDSSSGSSRSLPSRPTWSSAARTRRSISANEVSVTMSGSATLSNTGRSVSSRWSWNTMPTPRRKAGMRRAGSVAVSAPLTLTVPRVGRSSRPMSLSTVLLPAPERPVRNTISPRSTASETPPSASRPFG
ncbi:MAG: hypothetical protein U1F30_11225 [Steroidobacteraceae bacterium]